MSAATTRSALQAQVEASRPRASVFVSANAGSGKTATLVTRVARLLLAGSPPQSILCVTYTKAAAAEMQARLYARLGRWAVMDDEALNRDLAEIDEAGRDLRAARALFARALETPGGLKIQTIHGFCEKLLRRFPLEAGVSPNFTVLEDAAATEVSTRAREGVAELAFTHPESSVAEAYAHFSVQLDFRSFQEMFDGFAVRRGEIAAYLDRQRGAGVEADVWRRCGFDRPTTLAQVETSALAVVQTRRWRQMADTLAAGSAVTDQKLGAKMLQVREAPSTAAYRAVFHDSKGAPLKRLGTNAVAANVRDWLMDEQARCVRSCEAVCGAAIAEDTLRALILAAAYGQLYEGAKAERNVLDFADLIDHARDLLAEDADVAWVHYKLDNGLEHVLLDEAQDTAPGQWDILRALTGEFFHGDGAGAAHRTMFAVGDEKQSIFSFQGAAPERVAHETGAFADMAASADKPFARVPLMESWRSAGEILQVVDAVFSNPADPAGLRIGGEGVEGMPLQHRWIRDDAGCVDLWPLQPGEEAAADEDVWTPLDSEPARSANRLLAGRIAAAIVEMVSQGDAVRDRESRTPRACRWGDVLILVRRRGALFHEILRALKRAGVPAAGADRLKLAEHGVFADLVTLGRFVCFPTDDLAVAVLLRSPLCDVSEESLFDLAHGRAGRLWSALASRAGERPEWEAAYRLLSWAREAGRAAPPFDFYCRLLGRIDGEGRSMRQRILTRMSAEAEQALDAFIAQVLEAEQAGARDLETATAVLSGLDFEIKREQDEAGDEVRVMTTHGAKGLEAPIVILPDTASRARPGSGSLLVGDDGAFYWAPRKGSDCEASNAVRARRDELAEHESTRLLYVALTRARDRLIVCGIEHDKRQRWRTRESWYDYVQRAFTGVTIDGEPVASGALLDSRPLALSGGGEGWRFGPDPARLPAAGETAASAALPAWVAGLAPPAPPLAALTSPSKLGEDADGAAPSPLAKVLGLGRYRRGDLIHRLLQLLPEAPSAEYAARAARLMSREVGLTDEQRAEICSTALAVLSDTSFAPVFGEGSRPEVPLVGRASSLPTNLVISGRVDRLVVEETRVLVVDFKTNRPAPSRIEDVADAYILQMAIYRALLQDLYPGRDVEAALVWTDGPRLMPVPARRMDAAVAALNAARSR